MTLSLVVDGDGWRQHVRTAMAQFPGIVPVVKGNGYGFGRSALFDECVHLGVEEVAVGTVYEIPGTSYPGLRPIVLTPMGQHAVCEIPADAVVTIGSSDDLSDLDRRGLPNPILVKLRSSMQRYGFVAHAVPLALGELGHRMHGVSIHLPLATSPQQNRTEIERWLDLLPSEIPLYVSHLDSATYADLRAAWPSRRWRIRLGTALWHGDKSMLHLRADVIAVHPVSAGQLVGYRQVQAPSDGALVVVGCGSAHGVVPLADGKSPLHFARRRLALVEPPHMHTSMAFVPVGNACPKRGDWVDVQRPLTMTFPDVVEGESDGVQSRQTLTSR
jgi:alanine racemase